MSKSLNTLLGRKKVSSRSKRSNVLSGLESDKLPPRVQPMTLLKNKTRKKAKDHDKEAKKKAEKAKKERKAKQDAKKKKEERDNVVMIRRSVKKHNEYKNVFNVRFD